MGTGATVGHYRFDGWDLPTKYGWMHSGPGAQAATRMQDLVNRMADRLITSGDRVGGLLDDAQWAGAAAIAAGEAMRRGAGQIHQTAADAATAQRCVTELGESFQAAQHRVPSPNEIPSGLGDEFLHGAATGFNALSPFDVQSPVHAAMERRRELDQQANLALTDHMTTSRDRIEAIPTVEAPAPITVTGQLAGAPGGSVGSPSGAAPAAGGSGAAPATTTAAGWTGGVAAPPAGPGPGGVGDPVNLTGPPRSIPPGSITPRPLPVNPTGGPPPHPRPTTFPPAVAGAGPGGAAFGPGSGGRTGPGGHPGAGGRTGTGTRGATGPGVRPGSDGDGVPGRGTPGRDGPIGGPVTTGARGGGPGSRGGSGSFLQPPVGGHGGDDDDTEHKDRYAQPGDHIIGELPLVAPAVIGETPDEERHRLGRDGR